MPSKKVRLPSELMYVVAIFMLSFAVAMLAAADFGVSMIVAPAYITSLKFTFLTFGQCEYILQGVLFAAFCILMGKVKLVYFSSPVCCLIYGAVLDWWRRLIPAFNPGITPPGSMSMPVRIVFFIVGVLLTALSVATFFGTYLYPQVYDFFVKGMSARFHKDRTKFKRCFDAACLGLSLILTLLFFRRIQGIGVGTVIITFVNGILIGFFGRCYERYTEFVPIFKKTAERFDLTK